MIRSIQKKTVIRAYLKFEMEHPNVAIESAMNIVGFRFFFVENSCGS